MDFKKSFQASLIPIAILVAISVIKFFLNMLLSGIAVLLCFVAAAIFIAQILTCGWAGYMAVKKYGLGIADAALTGAITGLISAVIGAVIDAIGILIGVRVGGLATMLGYGGLAVGIAAYLIVAIIVIVFDTVVGAVLAGIGGFIATKK